MPKIDPFLHRIREFIEAVPVEGEEKVDWDELMERKEAARMALQALSKIITGEDSDSGVR